GGPGSQGTKIRRQMGQRSGCGFGVLGPKMGPVRGPGLAESGDRGLWGGGGVGGGGGTGGGGESPPPSEVINGSGPAGPDCARRRRQPWLGKSGGEIVR